MSDAMLTEIKRARAKSPDFTAIAIVTVVAFLASCIPALRVTRADPMIALSHNA